MKSFLSGVLIIREWKLCGRVLFHNGGFTNINWIGLWVTAASLTLICLIGNQVHTIHRGLKLLSRRMKGEISRLRKIPEAIRNLRRPATWFSKPVTIWSIFWLTHSLSRKGPRYSSSSGVHENSDEAEMDDLEGPSATPRQDNFGDTEDMRTSIIRSNRRFFYGTVASETGFRTIRARCFHL
jgi:hypothetical protein